jgi:hypothetical protein
MISQCIDALSSHLISSTSLLTMSMMMMVKDRVGCYFTVVFTCMCHVPCAVCKVTEPIGHLVSRAAGFALCQ